MAAQTITHTGGNTLSSDATFRTWGSAISTAIAAVGWVQTSDTGQVNWTTVTAPTAGTFTVYEIWKPGDSLQTTDPIYIKIMYSRSTGNAPRMQIGVGTATDGAGVLTSAANTNTSVIAANDVMNGATPNPVTVTHNSYINGDTSSLVLFLHPVVNGSANNGGLFCIERRRAVDGTPTTGGFTAQWEQGYGSGSATVSPGFQCVSTNNVYAQPASSTTSGFCLAGANTSYTSTTNAVRSNVVPAFPVMTGFYPELGAPSKWLLGVYYSDVPLGQTFQAVHYGASQTFMSVGAAWHSSAQSARFSFGGFVNVVPAVRID